MEVHLNGKSRPYYLTSHVSIRNPHFLIVCWLKKTQFRLILPPCVVIWKTAWFFFFNRKSSIRHLVRRNIGSGRRTIRDMVDNFCKSNYHITQILLAIHKEKGGLHHQMSKFEFTILAKNNILINDNGASRNHGVTRGRPPLEKKCL